jgi:hypothetical protein
VIDGSREAVTLALARPHRALAQPYVDVLNDHVLVRLINVHACRNYAIATRSLSGTACDESSHSSKRSLHSTRVTPIAFRNRVIYVHCILRTVPSERRE